ncbi:hypothetical protein GM415_08965 [Pseudodesulfovibrio cashew]|uniref:Uncharacterized protein n=1 Tax=Pseudodesulfovibrio cashew TaxID=2678688 RepID=A0A6I6JIW1_9BACT|nr:hypothetical protein [Pseudodesulfovibrio cashew]QGY40252.1 hypothetical protein GM415_08965 [Pseudodesulfovibrio cashew]
MGYDISIHVVFDDNSYIEDFVSKNLNGKNLFWDFREQIEKERDMLIKLNRIIGRSNAKVEGVELIPKEMPRGLCWVSKNDQGKISGLNLKIIGESSWEGFNKFIRKSSLNGAVVYFGDEHMNVVLYHGGLPVAETGGNLYEPDGFRDRGKSNVLVDMAILNCCYTNIVSNKEIEYVIYNMNKTRCIGSRVWFEESWHNTIISAIYDSPDYDFLFDYVVMDHDAFEQKYGDDTHCECIQGKLLDALFSTYYTPIIEKVVVGEIL